MEQLIGQVTHYFNHLNVAVVLLDGDLKIGDSLLFLGHTTDFVQVVCSIEAEHQKIVTAQAGMAVAIRVDEPVREGDQVYRLAEGADDPQNLALWKSMQQALGLLYRTYQAVFADFIRHTGLPDSVLGVLLAAETLEPGTISPEKLMVRGIYTAETAWMSRLHAAAEKGMLLEPEPGQFRLSQVGHQKIQALVMDVHQAIAAADPLEVQDSQRLANLLGILVEECLFTPPPPDTWSIRLAYQLMPADSPPLPYTEQALSCLQAYRDDAHLAAWLPGGLSGSQLETLTLLWRGKAASLDDVYDQLAARGFERHDYQAALRELRQRKWVVGKDQAVRLTEAGLAYREQVEKDTDSYFFRPWQKLETSERAELACLLSSLQAGLIAI